MTFYLQKITIYSLACKLARMEKSTAHRITLRTQSFIGFHSLSRDAISDPLSLSLVSLSHSAIFIWRFHFPLPFYPRKASLSAFTFFGPLQNCSRVWPVRLHHRSLHTLLNIVSVAPATTCRVESNPNRVHYLTSDAPINFVLPRPSVDPFGSEPLLVCSRVRCSNLRNISRDFLK